LEFGGIGGIVRKQEAGGSSLSFISAGTPVWLLSRWLGLLLGGMAVLCLFGGLSLRTYGSHSLKVKALSFAGAILMAGFLIIYIMR
jgi:hypothetical protein